MTTAVRSLRANAGIETADPRHLRRAVWWRHVLTAKRLTSQTHGPLAQPADHHGNFGFLADFHVGALSHDPAQFVFERAVVGQGLSFRPADELPEILLDNIDERGPRKALFRQSHDVAPRVAEGVSALVDDERDHDMPVARHAQPVADDPVHRTDLDRSVEIDPARLDIFGNNGPVAAQIDHRAVDGDDGGPA